MNIITQLPESCSNIPQCMLTHVDTSPTTTKGVLAML